MDNVKAFFTAIWGYVVLIGLAAIGVLAWLLKVKNDQLEAHNANIALAQTQKDADVIETQIKVQMDDVNTSEKDKASLRQSLDLLEQKRQSLNDPRTTDQEKIDYWNNNK